MQNPNFFSKTKTWISNHKFWTLIIILVTVFAIYEIVKAATPTSTAPTYVIGTATTGTVVATVSGTGQVSSSDQITVPAKSSGQLMNISVTPGDTVSQGQIIGHIDDTTESLALEQAKNNLAQAEQAYKNDQATQTLSLQNQQISLNSSVVAQASQSNADSVTPTISGSYNSTIQGTYTLSDYSCAGGTCIDIEGIESGTGLITPNIPIKIGTRGLYLTFASTPKILDTWTIAVPSPLASNYLSQSQNLATSTTDDQITLANDQQNITTAKLNLQSAQINEDNTYITSPIDGVVGQVSVVKGQNVSSGTTAVTLVSNQQYADITLNEINVAKIALGDRATTTFQAIDGLTLTGKIISIDQIGTVTQGVVNYDVKVGFDSQDPRVKSGMSVSVTIATAVHQNVVEVPSTAIKNSGGVSYVLTVPKTVPVSTGNTGMILTVTPTQTTVQTGISDDMYTEITSGLSDGDEIVTRTITATTKTAATTPSATSLLGGSGSRGGGGTTNAASAARALGR